MVRFKVQKTNAQSEFVFVTGDWQTDGFRQFGIYNATRPKEDPFQGSNGLGGYDRISSLTLQSDTRYHLLLAIGHNGHFLAMMWDPNNKAQRAVFIEAAGADWVGKNWIFLPKANASATVYVEDFYKIAFGDIKWPDEGKGDASYFVRGGGGDK